MVKETLNKLLSPYVHFEFNTDEGNSPLIIKNYKDELTYILTKDIKFPDVHKSIKNNGIEEKIYIHTYVMPATDAFFTYDNKWKFYLNGKSIYKYDNIKMILINGYLYLLSKDIITFDSFVIISTDLNLTISDTLPTTIHENNSHDLVLNFDNNFNYNETYVNGKSIITKGKYLNINAGQNILDALSSMSKPMEYLFSIKIKKILLVDTVTGISNEYDNLTIKPMMFILNNNNPNLKCYFFYEGLTPTEWEIADNNRIRSYYELKYPNIRKEDRYLEHFLCRVYDNPVLRQVFLDNIDILHPTWRDVEFDLPNHDRVNMYNKTRYLLNFNYDLFMEIYKVKHTIQHIIAYSDIKFVQNNKSIKVLPATLPSNRWSDSFIKFSFFNFLALPFDLYFFDRLYTSHYTTDREHQVTNVYIRLDNFLNYYNISMDDLYKLNGIVIIKPENYTTIDYVNVGDDYNGTLVISKDLFTLNGIKVYDNGYLLKIEDYSINNLPPVNMLAMFPKRKFPHHSIRITGFEGKHFVTKKQLHVKIKNFTTDEETDILDNNPLNKYIYKNLLYLDYIDFRYQIFIGPVCLIENVDYIINSPTCVEFIKPITTYVEELDLEYIDINIEYNGIQENRLLDMISTKSYRQRVFSNDVFRKAMYDIQSTIHGLVPTVIDNLGNDCPEYYPKPAYRLNMMITKYFSTEVIITTDVADYGEKWYNDLSTEFPDFIRFNAANNADEILMECDIDYPVTDYPRGISLPESFPLNMLMYNHIVADYKFGLLNYGFMKDVPHNNNKLYKKNYILDKIDPIFVNGDASYSPNIPINFVIDDFLNI